MGRAVSELYSMQPAVKMSFKLRMAHGCHAVMQSSVRATAPPAAKTERSAADRQTAQRRMHK